MLAVLMGEQAEKQGYERLQSELSTVAGALKIGAKSRAIWLLRGYISRLEEGIKKTPYREDYYRLQIVFHKSILELITKEAQQ